MIGLDWLVHELDTTCADKVETMSETDIAEAYHTLSDMCMDSPEGSELRKALRCAVEWLGGKYIDKMIEENDV